MAARGLSGLATLAVGMAIGVSLGASQDAIAARSCGEIGSAVYEVGEGQIYSVEGSVRARGVRCYRSRQIVRSYIHQTEAEGGRLNVREFRCRGGVRRDRRFIVDCRRDGKQKRIYLEGTGGPG